MSKINPERAAKKAAYVKLWRERFKARDPEGFKEYTLRKSRESHARMAPVDIKAHSERSRAWSQGWKARDPEGYKAYHKQKAAENYERRKHPDYRPKRGVRKGMCKAEYLLSRRLLLHGLSLEDYESMVSVVPGCAICGALPKDKYALHIDHDHNTGRVRGLLCNSCNTGLGKLGDNAAGLRAALEYLGEPRCRCRTP
jgi:hypothetical protein